MVKGTIDIFSAWGQACPYMLSLSQRRQDSDGTRFWSQLSLAVDVCKKKVSSFNASSMSNLPQCNVGQPTYPLERLENSRGGSIARTPAIRTSTINKFDPHTSPHIYKHIVACSLMRASILSLSSRLLGSERTRRLLGCPWA